MCGGYYHGALQTLEICLPNLPPRELSPNSRVHHLVRHQANLIAYDEIFAEVRAAGYSAGVLEMPLVEILWGVPDRRKRDWDNLVASTKPYMDGLGLAGVLRDDSLRHYKPTYDWFDSPRNPQTHIKVYE